MSNKIFLIRHAQSEGNVDKSVYYEKPDCEICITSHGEEQARECADLLLEQLSPLCNTQFYHSPYLRAVQTATVLTDAIYKDNAESSPYSSVLTIHPPDPLLREREWGCLRELVDNRHLKRESHFNFFYKPDRGESYADAYMRVQLFFTMLRLSITDNSDIVIVSHGEWIRLATMYLDGLTIQQFAENRKNPENCAIIQKTL